MNSDDFLPKKKTGRMKRKKKNPYVKRPMPSDNCKMFMLSHIHMIMSIHHQDRLTYIRSGSQTIEPYYHLIIGRTKIIVLVFFLKK